MTDAEFEAEYRGIWTEQSTPPCLYAIDPAAGKTRTDLPLTYRDYTMDACDGSTLYGEQMIAPYSSQASAGKSGQRPPAASTLPPDRRRPLRWSPPSITLRALTAHC